MNFIMAAFKKKPETKDVKDALDVLSAEVGVKPEMPSKAKVSPPVAKPLASAKFSAWTVTSRVVMSDEGGGWKSLPPFVLEGSMTEVEATAKAREIIGALLRYGDELHTDVEPRG